MPSACKRPVLPVSVQLSGGCELVVVLLDFSSGGSGEISVRCGQTVELVERSADRPGWCLVRTTDQTPQQVNKDYGFHAALKKNPQKQYTN